MKIIIAICAYFFVLSTPLQAQQKESSDQPDERIEVNKEYDENGNLIRYDSIYSYSSNNSGMSSEEMDAVFKQFFSKSSSFFESPFDMTDFGFPSTYKSIDSLMPNPMQKHKDFFDQFFAPTTAPRNDTIYMRKQSNN